MTAELDLGDGLTPVARLQQANEALKKELKRASLNYARVSVEADVVRRLSTMLRAETELREEQVAWLQAKLTELSDVLDRERSANTVLRAETELRAEQVARSQEKLTELSDLLDRERAVNAVLEARSRQIAELEQAPAPTSVRRSIGQLLAATRASIAFRLGGGRRPRGGGDDR